MRSDFLKLGLLKEEFLLHPNIMQDLYKIFQNQEPLFASVEKIANNSVTYEIVKNVAVISVDGAMYKKDMGGMCMSVASYQVIMQSIKQAENDENVEKILFRVTTVGGTAAGIDPLEEMIANCKKETAVIFEDVGASAGIYAFSACDKMYASEMTEVGSIGVVSGFLKNKGDDEVEYITSSRAKNKITDITTKEGKEKYLKKLDKREEKFYSIVEKNTGFTAEKIQEVFDNGDTIFAQDAYEAGFLQGVTTFQILLDNMTGEINTLGVNPASATQAIKIEKLSQGEKMDKKYSEEEYKALQATHAEALKTLGVSHQESLTAKDKEYKEALSTVVAGQVELSKNIVSMAFERGLEKNVVLEMLTKPDLDSAKVHMVDTFSTNVNTQPSVDAKVNEKEDEKKFQNRCQAVGITIIG
jgi:ClpP class serine protease